MTTDLLPESMPASPWSPARISTLAGRRALITGGNSGIGYYAALELARHGATVVLACRDTVKGEAAKRLIIEQIPGALVEVLRLDLASLACVQEAAAAQIATGLPLDLLINNAGVMAPKKRLVTKDGFELQFGTNVLGHFALTALLLPALKHAAEVHTERPRVVTIASIAHKRGAIRFDDLQFARKYDPMMAYAQSKLADLMFTFELGRRLQLAGEPESRILSVGAHPGVANTNLFQTDHFVLPAAFLRRWVGHAIAAFLNTGADGALPTLFAATSPNVIQGGYYGPKGFMEMKGHVIGHAVVAAPARDREAAVRLWGECERLTGTRIP